MILNKNEYKEAVNKIVISDELREKIIHNSSENKTYKCKRNNIYKYFRKAAGIAACFVFCMLSYYVITNYYHFPIDIPMNTTTPPIQTQDNSNSSDIKDNTIASVTPDIGNVQNNTDTSDRQHSHNNTSGITAAANSSAHDTANNSVIADSSIPESSENQAPQSNSSDTEHIEQDNFPPMLSAAPSTDDNTPMVNIVGNENMSGGYVGCGYSEENTSTIAEIEQELGYDIKIPNYIPDDYKTDSISAPFGEFAQITYTNETDTLYYRTAKDSEDISGDYNNYTDIETVTINDNDVTIKGNDNLYHNASWFDEDEAFSVYSDNGIEKNTMIDIVKSVD